MQIRERIGANIPAVILHPSGTVVGELVAKYSA